MFPNLRYLLAPATFTSLALLNKNTTFQWNPCSDGNVSPPNTSSTPFNSDTFDKVNNDASTLINRFQTTHGIPGVSMAVRINGRSVFNYNVGYANLETLTPMSSDVVTRIASISKLVTSLMCVENSVKLDEPINEILSNNGIDLQFGGEPVELTVRHLLNHTSGIRHYSQVDDGNSDSVSEEFYSTTHYPTSRDSLEMFIHDDLLFAPGSKFKYSTFGYTLLAFVFEKITGHTFPEKVREFALKLGLKTLQLDSNARIIPNRSAFYTKDKNRTIVARHVDNSNKYAGGGMLCSTADLARIGDVVAGILQNPTSCKEFENIGEEILSYDRNLHQEFTGYGLGLRISQGRIFLITKVQNSTVGHTGGAVGATSCLLLMGIPEEAVPETTGLRAVVVAITCNLEDVPGIWQMAEDIADLYLERYEEWVEEMKESYSFFLV